MHIVKKCPWSLHLLRTASKAPITPSSPKVPNNTKQIDVELILKVCNIKQCSCVSIFGSYAAREKHWLASDKFMWSSTLTR